ncbi:MAG TPA: hypothetical protein P5511_03995 [Candidatus Goldiibacteriota bacterium]|nr:hypothetical protein [Candidatus Goldiibacteriota bacterium]
MSWSEITRLLGIMTLVLALITFSLGYFKFKFQARLKLHKVFAFALVIMALVHGGIVFYRTYF